MIAHGERAAAEVAPAPRPRGRAGARERPRMPGCCWRSPTRRRRCRSCARPPPATWDGACPRVLAELGFPADAFEVAMGRRPAARDEPAVEVDGDAVAFDATGIDTVVFAFRPNPGEPARPLARIASGGELSRVALAVKQVLAEVDETPMLVFDEIDSRDRRPQRGPGRAQPVGAGPRPPGPVRHAPAPDRGLRRRPLPDRQARARRAHGDRDHPAGPRRSARRRARPDDRRARPAARRAPGSARELLDRAEAWRCRHRRGRGPTVTSASDLGRAIEDYLAYLRVERGVAEATIRAYRADLADFAMSRGAARDWAAGPGGRPPLPRGPGPARAGPRPGLAPTSLRRRTASIRGFYRFAFGDGLIAIDVAAHLDLPRQPRLLPETLTVDEVERLLEAVGGDAGRRWAAATAAAADGVALRDRALLELLYAAGLRVTEALGLDRDHLARRRARPRHRQGRQGAHGAGGRRRARLDRALPGLAPGRRGCGVPGTRRRPPGRRCS